MKKLALLFFFSLILFSCEKSYKEEIFNPNYQLIYGEWHHIRTEGGWTGGILSTDDYTIKFVPIGVFYNKDGKKGLLSISQQDDKNLLVDFHSLLGNLNYVHFFGNDTMSIADNGADMSYRLFVREAK
jgi:hypothetical protein